MSSRTDVDMSSFSEVTYWLGPPPYGLLKLPKLLIVRALEAARDAERPETRAAAREDDANTRDAHSADAVWALITSAVRVPRNSFRSWSQRRGVRRARRLCTATGFLDRDFKQAARPR